MSLETTKVTPSALGGILAAHLAADVPAMIWGPPGIGKSDLVRAAASAAGMQVSDLRLYLKDPVDLTGYPLLTGDRAIPGAPPQFTAPGDLPASDSSERWVIFLDELPAAPASSQKPAFQLVLDRRLNAYALPAGNRIIAAGNRSTDRAGATDLPTPLRSRFTHYELTVDSRDWLSWAYRMGLDDSVTSFLAFRPENLFRFDPAQKEAAFPCPRTWAMLARLAAHIPSAAAALPIVAGTVGTPAGVEFVAYLKMRAELPDPAGIWLDPDASPVPTEPSALYAISGALAAQVDFGKASKFIRYVSRYRSLEFTAMAVDCAYRRNPSLIQEPSVKRWCLDHQQLFEFAA